MTGILIPRKQVWTQQPQVAVGVNTCLPHAVGALANFARLGYESVSGRTYPYTFEDSPRIITPVGIGYKPCISVAASTWYATIPSRFSSSTTFTLVFQVSGNLFASHVLASCGQGGYRGWVLSISANYDEGGNSEAKINFSYLGVSDYTYIATGIRPKTTPLTCVLTQKNGLVSVFANGRKCGTVSTGTMVAPYAADPILYGAIDSGNHNFRGGTTIFSHLLGCATDDYAISLSINPWQLLAPQTRSIFVPTGAGGTTSVSADNAASYSVISAVSADTSANYAVRTYAASDATTAYAVRTTAQADNAASYNVRTIAQQDDSESYTVAGLVSADGSASYNVRAQISSDASAAYNVIGLVSADATASYNLRTTATADSAASYAVLSASSVVSSSTASYNVIGTVGADSSPAYSVRTSAQADSTPSYYIHAAVFADSVAEYNVLAALQSVQTDNSAAYDIFGRVQADIASAYAVLGEAAAEVTLSAQTIADLSAAIANALMAQLTAATIQTNMTHINGTLITGAGTESNPWGGN